MKIQVSFAFASLSFLLFCGLFSCNKKNDVSTHVLSSDNNGIFGKVLVYDEYGNLLPDAATGVKITVKGIDTSATNSLPFDSSFTLTADDKGFFSIKKCPTKESYSLSFTKDGFGMYKVSGISHSSASGDTIATTVLAKTPLATVNIDSIRLTKDNRLLYINRTVTLTAPVSSTYAVVTRYFFSNSELVSDKLYSYQWVSGATQGVGGYISSVKVQKATDLLASSGIDTTKVIYVRAYIDNIKYYGYKDSAKATSMIFPNITSPSNLVSFIMNYTK